MQNKFLRTVLGLLTALGAAVPGAHAQQQRTLYPEQYYGFRCATDSVKDAYWRGHPGEQQEYKAFLRRVALMPAAEQARLLAQPDVTVPVVVHIIHTGGGNNITDAQVFDAIRILNEDFSKTNRDTTDVIPQFQPIYANVGFRFRLAQKDPDGNCSTGITRTFSTQTNIGDNNVKNVIRWDPNRYLNVWVVDRANGAGGYAFLPCAPVSLDGIVILNTQFGSTGRSCGSNFCNRSFTHEVGHYFGLPHTWGGTNTPGVASNCGLDDGIADTPNTSGVTSGCPSTTYRPCNADGTGSNTPTNNPGGILANVQNYMDYATCAKMFTLGQKAVMRASLQLGCRSTLVSAANLAATGTNDGYQAAPCGPVAAFEPARTSVCEGGSIGFADYSYNLTAANNQYEWIFAGGQPATSSARNPTVTYPTAGIYGVKLIVSNANGRDTVERALLVTVQGPNSGVAAPIAESFENATFPQNVAGASPQNWRTSSSIPGSTLGWVRGTGVASNGSAFLRVPNNTLPDGTISTLVSPNINLTAAGSTPTLAFDRAYARRTATVNDQLRISFSTDCGATWSSPFTYNATALDTKGGVTQIGFVPTSAADWQTTTVTLPSAFAGSALFQLRLEAVSNAGNPLYLDNLRLLNPLSNKPADMARHGISVHPNPLTSETAVHFTLATAERAEVRLTDLVGREVSRTAAKTYGVGAQAIRLQAAGGAALPAGVYVVHLTLGAQTYTTKVLVQ